MYYVFFMMELFGQLVLLYRMTSYYPLRGGRSVSGADCGVFYVHANAIAGTTNWSFCAALSFKAYIIIYYIHGEIIHSMAYLLSSHYLGRNTVGPTRTNCILHF